MAMHYGAVLQNAQWPAVTCMNMYVDQLVTEPLVVEGGMIQVRDKPGLGVEFNEEALKYKVKGPEKAQADAIYAIVRPTGQKIWYPGEFGKFGFWTECWAGNVPICEHGVRLETWANDGSKAWKDLKTRIVAHGPVWESKTSGPSKTVRGKKR
jgi:galactonate dehydratase